MCGGGSDPGGSNDNTSTDEDFNDSTNVGGNDPTGNTGGQTDQGISDPSKCN